MSKFFYNRATMNKKCSRHLIYARACVNKDFVRCGSIGLTLGKHVRYVIILFFMLVKFTLFLIPIVNKCFVCFVRFDNFAALIAATEIVIL